MVSAFRGIRPPPSRSPGASPSRAAESPHGRERVLDRAPAPSIVSAAATGRNDGSNRREITQEATGTGGTVLEARSRSSRLVEQPEDLGEPRGQPIGVLEAAGDRPAVLLSPSRRSARIEHPRSEWKRRRSSRCARIRAPPPPRDSPRPARPDLPDEDLPHALAQLSAVHEAVQEIQLSGAGSRRRWLWG